LLDVESVKAQLGGESDEEIDDVLGKNPTKRVQQEELNAQVPLANSASVQSGSGKASERGAKGNSAKAQANLIKINLGDSNAQPEQAPASNTKAKGSKKNSKAEKGEKARKAEKAEKAQKAEKEKTENADNGDVMIVDKPDSPKPKKKPAKKKQKESEASKETDGAATTIIKETPAVMSGVKVGDLNQPTQIPMMPTMDPTHMPPQHYLPQHLQHHMLMPQAGFTKPEDFGMMLPNNMINPMLKSLSPEDLSRIMQGTLSHLGSNEDIINYSKMFNGISKDDKMYRNYMS